MKKEILMIIEVIICLFGLYILYEILRKMSGGSWGIQEMIFGLTVLTLGFVFHLAMSLSEVKTDVHHLRAQFHSLATDFKAHRNEFNNFKTDFKDMREDLDELRSNVKRLTQKVERSLQKRK